MQILKLIKKMFKFDSIQPSYFRYFLLVLVSFFPLEAKDPPNQISFTEGGIQKTFYRNANLEAEFIDSSQLNPSQNKSLGSVKLKVGWNFRQTGKPILSKSSKSNSNSKVTEVYNTGVGAGPNIVLPGVILVSFKKDQNNESLSKLAQKYNLVFLRQLSPRIASFQTEPGFISVEKANEILKESFVLEAYPETAVEKVLK